MTSDSLTIGAVGDIAAFFDEPETMFDLVADELAEADISFAQNERHYNASDATPIGTFTEQTSPDNAAFLTSGGFDVLSFASNHCMDLGAEPMMETVEVLRGQGFKVIGVGRNIVEARRPAIIERQGTKVGFLAYCSVLRTAYEADLAKPGAAPMRAFTLYHQTDYQPGTAPRIMTFPNQADLAALIADIEQLRSQVDVLVVSFHWGIHFVESVIADYQKDVAHAVIDAGADIIVGHHPHVIKGIEVYKGRPIFYSLGNFAFDMPASEVEERLAVAPGRRATYDAWGWVYTDPEWSRYAFPPSSRRTMIAQFTVEDRKVVRTRFVPLAINNRAQPEALTSPQAFEEYLTYVRRISADEGFTTKLEIDDGRIAVSTE